MSDVVLRVENLGSSFIRFSHRITFNIAPDEYVVGFALTTMQANDYAHLDALLQMELSNYLKICDVYDNTSDKF